MVVYSQSDVKILQSQHLKRFRSAIIYLQHFKQILLSVKYRLCQHTKNIWTTTSQRMGGFIANICIILYIHGSIWCQSFANVHKHLQLTQCLLR